MLMNWKVTLNISNDCNSKTFEVGLPAAGRSVCSLYHFVPHEFYHGKNDAYDMKSVFDIKCI
jgi:hypothetical protein